MSGRLKCEWRKTKIITGSCWPSLLISLDQWQYSVDSPGIIFKILSDFQISDHS